MNLLVLTSQSTPYITYTTLRDQRRSGSMKFIQRAAYSTYLQTSNVPHSVSFFYLFLFNNVGNISKEKPFGLVC